MVLYKICRLSATPFDPNTNHTDGSITGKRVVGSHGGCALDSKGVVRRRLW
jgi:hypothetical protein